MIKCQNPARFCRSVALFLIVPLAGCELSNSQPVKATAEPLSASYQQTSKDAAKVEMTSDKAQIKVSKEAKASKGEKKIEPLSSASFSGESITAGVVSHGCTKSTDFDVQHTVANGMCEVQIVRSKPDLCRRAPFVATININWSLPNDCADLSVTIVNPSLAIPSSQTLIKRTQ